VVTQTTNERSNTYITPVIQNAGTGTGIGGAGIGIGGSSTYGNAGSGIGIGGTGTSYGGNNILETQSRREGMESESVEAAPWEMQVMVLAREVQEMLMEVKVFMGLLEVQ
jgi:hypothetical protein